MSERTSQAKSPQRRNPPKPFPNQTLEEALAIASAVMDQNAGQPMNRVLLAGSVHRKPNSSEYRNLLSCSWKYGLTVGTEKAERIEVTDLGRRATRPSGQIQRQQALLEALTRPTIFQKLLEKYRNQKFPGGEYFHNMLEMDYDIPRVHVNELSDIFRANCEFVGLVRNVSGFDHLIFEAEAVTPDSIDEPSNLTDDAEAFPNVTRNLAQLEPASTSPAETTVEHRIPERPKQIFIAHGKNRKPVDEFVKFLNKFKVPHKVAVNEPNAGRPISQKVADLMSECTAGIFIFTKDEEFLSVDGETAIWRPSDNVIYELGAGSVAWGKKIIIFKEKEIQFASDFRDIGYITFDPDNMAPSLMELLQELIALDFVRFQAV